MSMASQNRARYPGLFGQSGSSVDFVASAKMNVLRRRVGRAKAEMAEQRRIRGSRISNSVHPMDLLTLQVHPSIRNIIAVFGSLQNFADACYALDVEFGQNLNIRAIDRMYAERKRTHRSKVHA